jgi:hypothetical protein
MNCSFRILDQGVYIGVGVRKSGGKDTVKFDNKPFRNCKILAATRDGFNIDHETFPKSIWVEFDQLPLINLEIKNGIISDELTFVERILTGRMELIKTETFDYLELLDDLKTKQESKTYGVKKINPGDVVISSICKNGLKMTFLGIHCLNSYYLNSGIKYSLSFYGRRAPLDLKRDFIYPLKSMERAIFLVEENKRLYLKSYALNNKYVKDLYKSGETDSKWNSIKTNRDFLNKFTLKSMESKLVPEKLEVDIHSQDGDFWRVYHVTGKKLSHEEMKVSISEILKERDRPVEVLENKREYEKIIYY